MKQGKSSPYSNFDYDSALSVQEGVHKPEQVSNFYLEKVRARNRKQPTVAEMVDGILRHDRAMLSRAITLVESSLAEHHELAKQVIDACLPYSGQSVRLGITGVPGAGKSTVIEALGTMLTGYGHKVAVLAIDPSSERSRGSILGDKTRMEELSADPNAFIRPSPSAGSLGGVARKTREIILLCEAAGFDTVIVETVGVGQSEVAAHSMVDFFLLIQLANTGDELQGIKRGIMEMADMVAINKCDIDPNKSALAAQQFRNALHLFPMPESEWPVEVMMCSAYTKEGIASIWHKVQEYVAFAKRTGYFYHKRQHQNLRILSEVVEGALKDRFYGSMASQLVAVQKQVEQGQLNAYSAADALIEQYFGE